MWELQWAIASTVTVVGLFVAWVYMRRVNTGISETTASPKEREDTYKDLLAESPKLGAFETPEFLLAVAVDLYERKHAAFNTLDDKAQRMVALIGGGAGLFALLGGFTSSFHRIVTPLLVVATICIFASLTLLLLSLSPTETDILQITDFNSPPVLADPAFRAKVARRLIDAWQTITLELTPILRRKGRFIFVAMLLIGVAAALLLTNFLLLFDNRGAAPAKSAIRCSISFNKDSAMTVNCVEAANDH
ncbi:MAG: hypothetical protein EPN48_18240 [Microbacteriaceae bacterium]|nr:MAG: hypothetical protein EPN48_18240 [Microbacteriaceae bacterium]